MATTAPERVSGWPSCEHAMRRGADRKLGRACWDGDDGCGMACCRGVLWCTCACGAMLACSHTVLPRPYDRMACSMRWHEGMRGRRATGMACSSGSSGMPLLLLSPAPLAPFLSPLAPLACPSRSSRMPVDVLLSPCSQTLLRGRHPYCPSIAPKNLTLHHPNPLHSL